MGRSLPGKSAPRGRTPKNLVRVASEKIAEITIVKALPAIEMFFAAKEFFDNYYYPNKFYILSHLGRLRAWFWNGIGDALGLFKQVIRKQIHDALTDILDYHFEVMDGPRDQQLFTIFIFQLLFHYEAGILVTGQKYGIDHFCNDLEYLLDYFGTLDVTSLECKALVFNSKLIISTLLRYLPKLKCIRLNSRVDIYTMRCLQENCMDLEHIQLKVIYDNTTDDIEDCLCKFFFSNLGKYEVLNCLQRKLEVPLSFSYLRSVHLGPGSGHEGYNLLYLPFFLQHFYPGLRLKCYNLIVVVNPVPDLIKYGILCPSFVEENQQDFYWDTVVIHLRSEKDDEEEESIGDDHLLSLFLKTRHISLSGNIKEVMSYPNFIDKLLRKSYCFSLEIKFLEAIGEEVIRTFAEIGQNLTELYLTGFLLEFNDAKQLYKILNSCVNLVALALRLDLVHDPKPIILKTREKLKLLSLKVEHYPNWKNFPVTNEKFQNLPLRESINKFTENILFEKELPAYVLRCKPNHFEMMSNVVRRFGNFKYNPNRPGAPTYKDRSHGQSLSKYVLKNYSGRSFEMPKRVESLKCKMHGPGDFEYDVNVKPRNFSGFGVAEVRGIGRSNQVICRYRSTPFVFYGNHNYGHYFSNNSLDDIVYRERSCRKYNDFTTVGHLSLENYSFDFPSEIDLFPKIYGHLPYSVKADLNQNRHQEANENLLPQWRMDMDFEAPLSVLRSLICSSPNLKVLEIPDLRVLDVYFLFCDFNVYKNLSKVHTLHLSCQFSKCLAEFIAELPSLHTVRVDPTYGVDNFLRFKKSLSWTNLLILHGESIVHPMSEIVRSMARR